MISIKTATRILISMMVVGLIFVSCIGNEKIQKEIEIGSDIPLVNKQLNGVSGKSSSLSDAVRENGLLVVFTCNTCPYVIASQKRCKEIEAICNEKKIGIVALNPNAARRDEAESMDEMKKYAQSQKYSFNYLVDKNSMMADAFGATRTPQLFLFDKNSKLVYRGAIDNSTKDETLVTKTFLVNAIENMMKDEKIDPNSTKAIGCGIKRKGS